MSDMNARIIGWKECSNTEELPKATPMHIKKYYRIFESILVCALWMSITLVLYFKFGLKVHKNPMGPVVNFLYAAITRASRAFVSAYTTPFVTNVIRDYKCIEWDDYWTSILVVSIVKAFGIVQDLVHVFLVLNVDIYVFIGMSLSELSIGILSTHRYMAMKLVSRQNISSYT